MKNSGQNLARGVITLLLTVWSGMLLADDTEIYTQVDPNGGGANILFILDSSGSMSLTPEGEEVGADDPGSRYQIMKNALLKVVGGIQGVNVGLQSYGGHLEGGQANGIKFPITAVSEEIIVAVQETIDNFKVEGYTPIAQSLYEATRYFRGESVVYGKADNEQRRAHPLSYTGDEVAQESVETGFCNRTFGTCDYDELPVDVRDNLVAPIDLSDANCQTSVEKECFLVRDEAGKCPLGGFRDKPGGVVSSTCRYQYTVAGSVLDATYIRPINNECQKNYIVLLSDGAADTGQDKKGNPIGADKDLEINIADEYGLRCSEGGLPGPEDGLCGPELTNFLATVDQNGNFDGAQNVNTYVVGFAIEGEAKDYLELLAQPEAGSQGFFGANNEAELVAALEGVTDAIAVRTNTLSPPAVTVDPNNGLVNMDAVFVPMFLPNNFPRWQGNLKRYRLETPDAGTPFLEDLNEQRVLDANKRIVAKAQSFWSVEADGPHVTEGGAAALLGDARTLYTQDLNNQLLSITVANIQSEWLGIKGVDNEAERKTALVEYLQGLNSGPGTDPENNGKAVRRMGDILHSRPVIVPYGKELEDIVVFVGTNEGYLHAIRASDGHELFAFMPRTLLNNTQTLYDNRLESKRPYGMDGWISVWQGAEHTYLYAGMRRGGNNYYALDITDIEAPKLLWTIQGGEGDFEQLAQTWTKPIVAQVELKNAAGELAPRDVLIFSGGYDANAYDDDLLIDAEEADDDRLVAPIKGNAVYIVDAKTGERLWWASDKSSDLDLEKMTDSIPANLRVLDLDDNGITDRIYLVDVVGKIFRIDLPDSGNTLLPDTEKEKLGSGDTGPQPGGYMLADLSLKTGLQRMFFYEPDVARVKQGTDNYLSISLGSGFRANPLRKGLEVPQDRLYSIKDPQLMSIPDSTDAAIIEADLVDVIEVDLADVTDKTDAPEKDKGWFINLDKAAGEKALARAVTFDNTVFFTTFLPSTVAGDACSSAQHSGRVYAISVFDASAVIFKDIGDVKPSKRYLELGVQDILSEVYLNIGNKDGKPVVSAFVDANFSEPIGEFLQQALQKIFWEEETNIGN